MSRFGKRPWGASPFGSTPTRVTGTPLIKDPVQDPIFGQPVDSSAVEAVLSLTEFETAIFSGNPQLTVNTHHVSAYVGSFFPKQGTHAAPIQVHVAKTWSDIATYQAYTPTITSATSDLGAIVQVSIKASADVSAYLFAFGAVFTGDPVNLPATLQPITIEDFPAILAAIDAANLLGSIESIPGVNLPSVIESIPGIDLPATGGGHFPEDIPAMAAAVEPVQLPVFLRAGYSDVADISASLSGQGRIDDFRAHLKVFLLGSADLLAKIRVTGKSTLDMQATLQPYREVNLPASIITQRIRDVRAIILGFSPDTLDLPASIARIDSASFDVSGYVVAQFIALVDIAGKLRAVQLGGNDVPSSLTAVLPFFNISTVPLQFIPLTDMDATLTQTGGHLSLRAGLTPVHRVSTGEADDAGFITTASSYKFYLGTTSGLFIPAQVVPQVVVTAYINKYSRPDLHASITGWNETDLSASLSVYPFSGLPAMLVGIGLDHLSDVVAAIHAVHTGDLQASLSVSGGLTNIQATLSPTGVINDFGATLIPFVDPLSMSVISVSTQPIYDLGASINYDSFVKCSPTSVVSELSAYIKPIITGTADNMSDMSAEILSSLAALDMSASIIGRKRTRIRILDLTFTAKNRGTETIRASITPEAHEFGNLTAQVVGLLHEADLPATILPVRYALNDSSFTAIEKVLNLSTGEIKDVLVSFRSQVQHYVYEDVTDAVYATDRGTWAIDLRTLMQGSDFFNRSLNNREQVVDSLQEYYSLDEAIRAGVVILCERRQAGLTASLTVRGAVADLGAQAIAYSLDNVSSLPAKIMPVVNLPDLGATINIGSQMSDLFQLSATLTPGSLAVVGDIIGSIIGDVTDDLTAEITAV